MQEHHYEIEVDATPEEVWEVGRITVAGIMPRLTFVLDMPASEAAQRINRQMDRMEAQGLAYLEKVRQGFLAEAARQSDRIVVIDAAQPMEAVHADALAALHQISESPDRAGRS